MIKETIAQHVSADELAYIQNKHRGGHSNRAGANYEDCFVAYQLLVLFFNNAYSPNKVFISEQVWAYVDDLKIDTPVRVKYFQLKNSATVSWRKFGCRGLRDDFSRQFVLSQKIGEAMPVTTLVVSCSHQVRLLLNSMPNEIAKHTDVCFFPDTNGSLNKLVIDDFSGVKAYLKIITMIDNPSDEVLEGTFASLLIAKRSTIGVSTVAEVFEKASKLYPSQVRPFPFEHDWSQYLLPSFIAILDAIPGLRYGAERGVFHWNGYGTSGVFAYAVNSDPFIAFQKQIISHAPHNFENFEKVLP